MSTSKGEVQNGNHNGYSTWEQVAGYSDGEGSISISITRFGFSIGSAFADSYKPLLEHVASFLQNGGFYSTLALQRTKGKKFWRLRVRRNDDTVSILSLMLPHLDKKQDEARAAIDYPTDKIDGVELATRINEQVKIGGRMGEKTPPRRLSLLQL